METENVIGWCMKCKEKKLITEGVVTPMNNPKNPSGKAVKGKCETCGTGMFKILPNEKKC